MRAIPFRVVCLLGMNGDAFPRVRRPLGFDLVARHPRRGDRSAREDDRYLFLEALLSARDRLLITYVGQSIRDNAELPPSVVVSELLDTLGESFVVPDDGRTPRGSRQLESERRQERIRERLVVRHPLQPFSVRYFRADEPRLFSYARAYHRGAVALAGPRGPAPPFVGAPLPADEVREVRVDDLVRFFEHPASAFLQRRLLVWLGRDAEPIDNREPLELDDLDVWSVGQQVLARVLAGEHAEAALGTLRGKGLLPLGVPGDLSYREVLPEVAEIARRARRATAGDALPPVEVEGEVDGVRLTGRIGELYAQGHVRVQFSRLGRRSELATWIRHLLLAAFAAPGVRQTILVGRPTSKQSSVYEVRFRAPSDARALLAPLVALYRVGLAHPLPFFPVASRAYAESRAAGKPAERALHDARRGWDNEHGGSFERDDDYNRLAFAGRDVLAAGFAVPGAEGELRFGSLAEAVFAPLLAHRVEVP
jgi:exodeoxyribonuclease V gamma subunit